MPLATGSVTLTKTIGIVRVSRWRASFTMGSPDSEEGRIEEEGPQHRLTLGKAFGVGKFVVTFEEWDACVAIG